VDDDAGGDFGDAFDAPELGGDGGEGFRRFVL
jgi:hypothetical protein